MFNRVQLHIWKLLNGKKLKIHDSVDLHSLLEQSVHHFFQKESKFWTRGLNLPTI